MVSSCAVIVHLRVRMHRYAPSCVDAGFFFVAGLPLVRRYHHVLIHACRRLGESFRARYIHMSGQSGDTQPWRSLPLWGRDALIRELVARRIALLFGSSFCLPAVMLDRNGEFHWFWPVVKRVAIFMGRDVRYFWSCCFAREKTVSDSYEKFELFGLERREEKLN